MTGLRDAAQRAANFAALLSEFMDCCCENFGVVIDVRFGGGWGHQRHVVEWG